MTTVPPEKCIAKFVTELIYDDLPDDCIETVISAFVDTVGVTLAGIASDAGRISATTMNVSPDRDSVATLLSLDASPSPESAALRVGTASHALDYDDLSWAMDGHPSVTLIPPLLVLSEQADATGQDFVTAYAAGFETACAVAKPVSPAHYEAGWHATATFGTFGATAAAAHLLDLDIKETQQALSIAASMPSGLKRNFGSMTKPLHAGLCSRSGVTAARLASNGFSAERKMVSGDGGFWDLYGPGELSEFNIGDGFTLRESGVHTKLYPCCYFTHTAISATQSLVEEGIEVDAIDRIKVEAAPGAGDALVHPDPETGLEAKFSMEYCVASAAVRDRVGLSVFNEDAIDDPTVQQVRERVKFTVDETLPYDSHKATVSIEAGEEIRKQSQADPPGTHDNPLSKTELRAKFDECVSEVLDETAAAELYDALTSLPNLEDPTSELSV